MKKSLNADNRVKVMLVVPSLSTGGGEKLVFELARNIDRERFEVFVVTLYERKNNLKEEILESEGIKLFFLNKSVGINVKTIFDLKRLINEIKPDVIHSHLDVLLYLIPSYKRRQVKLLTVHSIASFEARGVHKIVRDLCFKLLGVVPVAIGDMVKSSIAEQYGLEIDKIPLVYNGASAPAVTASLESEPEKVVIVSIGTIHEVKNFELLIKSFSLCLQETDRDVELRIVGDGPDRNKMEQLICTFGLQDKIKLLGWRDDVYKELCDADIYVCSSLVEGISIAIIEAMMCGLPIIASKVGGNSELVSEGVNGLLFESNNSSQLKEAILRLIQDNELRLSLSKGSLQCSERYDIRNCAREYEKLYRPL